MGWRERFMAGRERTAPLCCPRAPENAGTLEIPALPTFPPCSNYSLGYSYYFPYSFLLSLRFPWEKPVRQQFCLPPSCLVTTTPPGLSPPPGSGQCLVASLPCPGRGPGGRGGVRAGAGGLFAAGGFRVREAAMLQLRDGQPGSSRRLWHRPWCGWGPGGVSPRVRAPVRIPRPGGEGAARRGRGGSGRGAGPGALLQPGFLCSECPLNMRCHRLPLPLPAVPALRYFYFFLSRTESECERQ